MNRRFGKLLVRKYFRQKTKWLCLCDCGVEIYVTSGNLREGKTKSCGCLQPHHGHAPRNGKTSPTYVSWYCMIQRCTNKNLVQFDDYGGRGIAVCARWKDFRNFLADMGDRPAGKSLDRFPNNDGNYEPNNCRWATSSEQNKNRRKLKGKEP